MASKKKDTPEKFDFPKIKEINSTLNQMLNDENNILNGINRQDSINKTHNRFNDLIKNSNFGVNKFKDNTLNSYDYISRVLTGQPLDQSNNKKIQPNTPKNKLAELFTGTDSNIMSYFMNTSSNIIHICDEIESVCAYLYQLEEAIDIIRDGVLTAENVNDDIAMNISFTGITEDTSKYDLMIRDSLREKGIIKKVKNHVVPKMIKFGSYYMMVVPYSDIVDTMLKADTTHSNLLFEDANYIEDNESSNDFTDLINNIQVLIESCIEAETKDKKTESVTSQMDIIKENIQKMIVCEDTSPPNTLGIDSSFTGVGSTAQDKINKSILEYMKSIKSGNKKTNDKDNMSFADGVSQNPEEMRNIPGCDIKLVDPRQMVPIKIFDHVIGYYYFENYDYAKMGTNLTDLLSNQVNFNDRTMVIDNITGAILKNLKYGHLLSGDDNFKNLILNCILHRERRNNPFRLKFVSPEYVVDFTTNEDENGNGQPVLLRSLFFGRLYLSLLMFNITTLITKSTDTEFYYLNEGYIDDSLYGNQISDIIDQLHEANIDPAAIFSGNLMHGTKAINKRYFVTKGVNDNKPFDIDIVSGQQVDLHNEFLNDIKKMAIGSTGVPEVMIDFTNEVEYATQLTMANIKLNKRCLSIQLDIEPALTKLVKMITRFCNPNGIPDNIIESINVTLKRSKNLDNTLTNNELNDATSVADTMVETYYTGEESETKKKEAKKRILMDRCSSLPWSILAEIDEEIDIDAKIVDSEKDLSSGSSDE